MATILCNKLFLGLVLRNKCVSIRHFRQARSHNMSTVGVTASPVGCKHKHTFHFACTAYVKLRMHGRKKRLCQHHKSSLQFHTALCNNTQNIFHIHFWKRVVSNRECSTEATPGCRSVWQVFWRVHQHACVWYFSKFLVGACWFVVR